MIDLTREGFVKRFVDEAMRDGARRDALNMPALRGSITNGNGNYTGLLGERVALSILEGSERDSTYNHDLIWQGKTFDVKTKLRHQAPKLSDEASISSFNATQTCDFYLFVSLWEHDGIVKAAHLVGVLPPAEYKKVCYWRERGLVDDSNDFRTPGSCYNVFHHQLDRFGD